MLNKTQIDPILIEDEFSMDPFETIDFCRNTQNNFDNTYHKMILQFLCINNDYINKSTAYIPWLGYFERIYSSDLHVVLNHVQFEKNSFINRNKILTKQGPKWLTIPTTYADQIKSINKCKTINNKKWINVHLKSLYQNYSKANYFKMYFQKIEKILLENINQDNLFQIISTLNLYFFEELEIKTKIIYSDKLNITSKKSDLVFDICKYFNLIFIYLV